MNEGQKTSLLFVINPGSGSNSTDWHEEIKGFFTTRDVPVKLLDLDESCSPDPVKKAIDAFRPDRVIAVGGDGTVKLVAECLMGTAIPLGILPGGSANGMAKELGIPTTTKEALELTAKGVARHIHLVKINGEHCIHLADLGFNAFVIKKFETDAGRGMWGYVKAAWKVLWEHPKMAVEIKVEGKSVKRMAAMVVIANATKYGGGALINPEGKLDDDVFEVIIVKKISLAELYKMMVTHVAFDPAKTEVYQTRSLQVRSRVKAHFQVDGEYLGKVNDVQAEIIPSALSVIVPAETMS
jgi:diacylglycerol kinase (ATP)